MHKASISIPYVVAFLLGIITLVVAVYLMYRYIWNAPVSCQECNAQMTAWCVKCYKIYGPANWGGTANAMDNKLQECIIRCNLGGVLSSCGPQELNKCKAYIPL